MDRLRCLVNGIDSFASLELELPISRRGPNPDITGSDVVVTVATSCGYCDIMLAVEVVDNSGDVVRLVMDWFVNFISHMEFYEGVYHFTSWHRRH